MELKEKFGRTQIQQREMNKRTRVEKSWQRNEMIQKSKRLHKKTARKESIK